MKALLLRITASFGTAFLTVLAFCFVAHAAPQTFTVTSNADDPAVAPAVGCATVLPDCTLRSAIQAANANGNPGDVDIIEFNIGGGGHQTITPGSIYDNIVEPVNINGETQPGSSCGTMVPGIPSGSNTPHVLNIEIDDTALGWFWFDPGSDGSIVRGLNIHSGGAGWANVIIQGSNNMTVECNYLGTNNAGTGVPASVSGTSILVNDISTGTLIQNNLISGNVDAGIFFIGSGTVQNNLIGTDVTGNSALPNANGISGYITTDALLIDTNIISGNNWGVDTPGVGAQFATPDYTFTNNNIGLGLSGAPLPNTSNGIDIRYVQSATFTSNTVENNGGVGIQVISGHNVNATTNIVSNNGTGFYVQLVNSIGDSAILSSNIVNNNSGEGMLLEGDNMQVLNNTTNSNSTYGISFMSGNNQIVSNNTANNNISSGGISVTGATQVNNNITNNNGANGMTVIGNNTAVYNNTANNNDSSGLVIVTTSGNVHDNTMDGNNTGMILAGDTSTINNNTMINSTSDGLDITAGTDNVVTHNYIGVQSNGTIASNTLDGIFINGVNSVTIGGNNAAARNFIAGNLNNGIHVFACGTNVTQGVNIIGNYIGTNLSGSQQSGYGNGGSGVVMNEQSLVGCGGGGGGGGSIYHNIIGGDGAGEQNTIVGNGRDGVRIFQAPGMDVFSNAVLPNVIYANANLGINLAADSANSGVADQDLGPNALNNFLMAIPAPNANYYLNHPIINSSSYNGNQLTINYSFDANQADNSTLFQSNVVGYRLDFYLNDNAQDGAYPGYNQGKTYLGYFIVNGSETNATHTFTSPVPLSNNQSINAEATVLWLTPGPP